jgi:hypothetical protein
MANQNQIRRLRQIIGTEESIGILGDGGGVIFVAGKNGFVWVRDPQTQILRDLPLASSVTFDKDAHGKPVRLGYVRGVLSVLGVHREAVISGGGNVYIDNPTQAPVLPFIPQQRIMPLVVYPASVSGAPSFELIVRAWMWMDEAGTLHHFAGDRVDLSGLIPSSDYHCWAVIGMKRDGTLEAVAGDVVSAIDPLGLPELQSAVDSLSAGSAPIWGWVLNGDGVGLSENDINQDLRQFINLRPPKHNLHADTAPTINDDATRGYEALSWWRDVVAGELFVCVDATPSGAVWVLIA